MQSSLSEPMLNNTGNASSTQRLLEGQTDPATTTKALAKPDAWVQAGKTLFQRATGTLMCQQRFAPFLPWVAIVLYRSLDVGPCFAAAQAFCVRMACSCLLADRSYDGAACVMKSLCNMVLSLDSCARAYLLVLTGNSSDKVKMLNMGQHILDSLDTPQQLYQVCSEFRSHVCRA